jgi:hypothetical protein
MGSHSVPEAEFMPNPIPDHPAPGMHIHGWMIPDELIWLGDKAAKMRSVVEVGCLYGRSAFAILEGCQGPVYCVDPWWDDRKYHAFLRNCGHFSNLRAIRASSPEAISDVPDVDMVFIDGDHKYPSVVADIEGWLPKTRRLICGHDYNNREYPGVKQAVDEIFGERVRIALPSPSMIWFVELE